MAQKQSKAQMQIEITEEEFEEMLKKQRNGLIWKSIKSIQSLTIEQLVKVQY